MKTQVMELVKETPHLLVQWLKDHLGNLSSHTLGWIGIVLLHLAPIPTLLAVLWGQNDKLPPLDLMIFVWAALITMFFRSLIDNNKLYLATISMGFAAQAFLMSLILFK
jgi:hypothetical protein